MYADYIWYADTYGGTMTSAEWDIYAPKADNEILYLICNRDIPTDMETNTKYAESAIADLLKAFAIINPMVMVGFISSENTDGESVSFVTSNGSPQKLLDAQIKEAAKKYLTFPVNLMYCGR